MNKTYKVLETLQVENRISLSRNATATVAPARFSKPCRYKIKD